MTYDTAFSAALYELASDADKCDTILADLEQVVRIFDENPDYIILLSTPCLEKSERIGLIEQAFANSADRYVINFLKVLCEKNFLHILPLCLNDYRARLYSARDIIPIIARTAVALTDVQYDDLKNKLHTVIGKEILLKNEVDPSVLGGVCLTYSGIRLDGSVASRFRQIREAMLI